MLASWHEGDLVCRRVVQEAYNVTMLALVLKLIFDLLCLRNRWKYNTVQGDKLQNMSQTNSDKLKDF